MDNILKFKLELEEMMSGTLKRMEGTTHDVFGNVDRDIKNTQRNMNDLERPVRMNVDASGIRAAREEMGLLQESTAMFLGSLAERGLEKGMEFVREQVTDVFKEGMQGGRTKMMLEVQMGDKEGEELHHEVHENLGGSLYGPEMFQRARELVSAGENREQTMTDLLEMEDIAAGDPGNMQAIVGVMRRIKMKESLTMRELMPLTDAGFNPALILAEKHGGTQGQWMARLEDQGKALGLFREAMKLATDEGGKFHDMQKRMINETSWGKERQLETNIGLAKESLGVSLQPAEMKFLQDIQPLVEALPGELERMRPAIEGLIEDFTQLLKWTSNNTDTIKGWVKAGIMAGEVMIAWKVATVAYTAINWLWVASIGAEEAATISATGAMEMQNAAIITQIGEVEALGAAYAGLGEAETVALLAQKNFALSGVMAGAGANEGAGMLASSVLGAGSAVITGYIALGVYAAWEIWEKNKGQTAFEKAGGHSSVHVDPYTTKRMVLADVHDAGPGVYRPDGEYWTPKPETYKKKESGTKLLQKINDTDDAIISGGPKQVIIHARFGEHMINHFGGTKEGVKEVMTWFKEEYLKLLASIPGAE